MSDYQEGATATNPRTGQKVVFRGGQWHAATPPAGAPTPTGMFGGGSRPLTGAQAQAAAQRQSNLTALARQFGVVQDRYNRDLKGVGPASLLEYLPLPRNKAFNSAASGLSEVAQASFRVPGVGSQSDLELAAFIAANQPQASDPDEQIEAKLANIRNRIEASGAHLPGDRAEQFRVVRK